jgi:ribosomal protein L12E/L44/L45/RPP1/RPP2
VVRTGRVNVEFILPATGVLQERKDIRQLIVNVLEDADVKDVIENLNNYY